MESTNSPESLENIFPKAERAVIEQTIGHQMPNASPPPGQIACAPVPLPRSPDFFPWSASPDWFSPTAISKHEASVFGNTPAYLEIRNRIMETYRTASGPISISSCLALGPCNTVLRIFDFLEDSRLINFETDLRLNLSVLRAAPPLNASLAGHSMSASLEQPDPTGPAVSEASGPKIRKRYVSREFLERPSCQCENHAEMFTTDLHFVCNSCFESGQYPSRYTPRNFHKITRALLQTLWTKRDEFQLLKNIEIHGDDWERVSEGLNKTRDQCIFHFLKMSLMDECPSFPSMCFSCVPNPVSTFTAYVSYMIHPSVACEVARTAIKYIDRANVMEILISVAVNKAADVLVLEKAKRARLGQVGLEGFIRRASLKVEAIRAMHGEVKAVRTELESARVKLMDEMRK